MSEIIPPNDPPPTPTPTVSGEGKIITCEGCQSRVDRKGNLIRRGDRLREALDAEDAIVKLKKTIDQLTAKITEHEATISDLRSKQPEKKKSLWSRDA